LLCRYAAEAVFDICDNQDWKYLITFKKGSMPATYEEYELLKPLHPDNLARKLLEDFRTKYTDSVYPDGLLPVSFQIRFDLTSYLPPLKKRVPGLP